VQEVIGEPLELDIVPFDPDSPSTSSSGMYEMEVPEDMEDISAPVSISVTGFHSLSNQPVFQPPSKKVAMLATPQETHSESNSKTKKVVKMADNHTFEAPAGATYEDPSMSLYGEMMDLMKKFNQVMSIHVSNFCLDYKLLC